jgi:regulator of sirC expression with transglutaminase-like and TPR domain
MENRNMNIRTIVGRPAVAFLFLVLVAQGATQAKELTRADAIRRLESLAAKTSIEESCLDLALAADRIVDPNLNAVEVKRQIAAMAKEVRAAAAGKDAPIPRIIALNTVIFQKHGYSAPDAEAPILSGKDVLKFYMLNRFIETRQAYCEGLSTLYLAVAEAAEMPIKVCNAPIHTYCRYEAGDAHFNIECTDRGHARTDQAMQGMNGAKPAAVGSKVYFCPLSKRQFLCLHINSIAYGLAKQEKDPAPLSMEQMVQLAEMIEKLDPNHPESLDTAAMIHAQAGNPQRAAEIEERVIKNAEKYGTTGEIITYFRTTLQKYNQQSQRSTN